MPRAALTCIGGYGAISAALSLAGAAAAPTFRHVSRPAALIRAMRTSYQCTVRPRPCCRYRSTYPVLVSAAPPARSTVCVCGHHNYHDGQDGHGPGRVSCAVRRERPGPGPRGRRARAGGASMRKQLPSGVTHVHVCGVQGAATRCCRAMRRAHRATARTTRAPTGTITTTTARGQTSL